jgi:hypothetical protein
MINGTVPDAKQVSMVSCYIQQDDLFFGTLTVKEHLQFHVCQISFRFQLLLLLYFMKGNVENGPKHINRR